MDEIQTAIHEAGHAVAHVRLRLDMTWATIVPRHFEESVTLGAVTGEGDPWNASDAQAQVLAYCAGYAACVVAGWSDEHARSGTGDDFDKANQIIEFWALEGLENWLTKSVELLSTPETVRAIHKIADELIIHKAIGGGYISILCDWADGDCTEDELEDYKRRWPQQYWTQ